MILKTVVLIDHDGDTASYYLITTKRMLESLLCAGVWKTKEITLVLFRSD